MKKAIGIDLGTSNSVIAFKDTAVKIIRNKENEELTRSCIGLNNGETLVGQKAYMIIKRDPINTILSVKRLMGGAYNDRMVKEMIESPYYKYGITSLKGGTDDAVAIILGGKQYTPEQLSAEILKKLKTDAEEKFGDEVTHAVITVPAYFTEKQKNATRIAAQLAGLKVQKLLAEPTAAAIAYGVDNIKAGDAKTVLIYDFGGGTFDLSILNIVDGQYMEAGTGGDRWLGGDDIDRKLQSLVYEKVTKKYDINNIETLVSKLPDKKRYLFEGEMRLQTESAKIQLSSATTADIYIDNILEDENEEIIDVEVTITRVEFENLVRPFVERSIELIESLLKEVGYDILMVDNILLVGGTSCIPLVKQMLIQKYGKEKIITSEKPMLAIAEGAGILSHRLGDEYEAPIEGEIALSEISYTTNHNYFIELKDDYDRIIEKQMPLPLNVIRNYKTTVNNQKVVKVGIYSDIENGEKIRETFGFFAIEEDLPKGSDIVLDITLSIDEIFEVKAYPRTNKAKSKNIVLGRGNKDSKTLEFLSNSLEKIICGDFSEAQRDYFFKSVSKEIEKINNIGNENYDSTKWDEIGTKIYMSFEQTENVTDSIDEDQLAIVFATILIGEYPDLVGSEDTNLMKALLFQVKNEDDSLQKNQALSKLKALTEEYPVLITLFTIKMSSDAAAKQNPSDAHQLLQMHDQIVNHFRNRKKEQAFALLNEAIELRDKYSNGSLDLEGSIHLIK